MFWQENRGISLSPSQELSKLTCHPPHLPMAILVGHVAGRGVFAKPFCTATLFSGSFYFLTKCFGMSYLQSIHGNVAVFNTVWRCESTHFPSTDSYTHPEDHSVPGYYQGSFLSCLLFRVHIALLSFLFSNRNSLPSVNRPAPLAVLVLLQIWGSCSSHQV